jgi:hypothetical protein
MDTSYPKFLTTFEIMDTSYPNLPKGKKSLRKSKIF